MKKIFVIDWSLLLALILTAVTGFGLHAAGHGSNHTTWELCAVAHAVSATLFFTLAVWHIKLHWGWYRGWLKQGLGKKSRVTVILTIVMLIVWLTGLAALAVVEVNSHVGLWHYKIGILAMLIAFGHFVKRFPILRKNLK